MSDYIDLDRIALLEQTMGAPAGTMVASMLASITQAIERLEAALDTGELEPAIQATHAARNDALMLGAGLLQSALTDLEAAARNADEPRAGAALERVRGIWPPTRDALARVARQNP